MKISAKGVSFSYGKTRILSGIDAELEGGKFTAILGGNGAGKSTFLKILSGWLKPDCGAVFYDSQNIARLSARRLSDMRAVLEQQDNAAFDFSVSENVAMCANSRGFFAPRGTRQRVLESLEKLGIAELADRRYSELSGGEKRKVQLARVLFQIGGKTAQSALLLDEPAASLDPAATRRAMLCAREAADGGACVAAVLHDPNLALEYCDEAVLIFGGKIFAKGKVAKTVTKKNLDAIYGYDWQIRPSLR